MPDWAVQSPVSTVRPTPPRPKAAAAGGSGSPHSIRASASSSGYSAPTFSVDWSNGSTALTSNELVLSESGIWHVSFQILGTGTWVAGAPTGYCAYLFDGTEQIVGAIGSNGEIDEVTSYYGSGSIDVEVASSATVAFSTFSVLGATPGTTEHRIAAHWVGP